MERSWFEYLPETGGTCNLGIPHQVSKLQAAAATKVRWLTIYTGEPGYYI
jgi:hypothetical protein